MSIQAKLQELIEPIVAAHGLEVFDLHYGGAALTVLVDRPRAAGEPRERTGVDMEAITSVTRAVSRALDEADPISGHYSLEVSSPGLERPLRTPAHFAGAVGELVSIKTTSRYDGPRRLRGTLERAGAGREAAPDDAGEGGDDPDTVTVRLQDASGEVVTVAYADIEKARTVFEWHPEPKSERPGKAGKRRRATRAAAGDETADGGAADDETADEEPGAGAGDADGGSATTAGHDAKINGDDEKVSAT